MAGRRRRSLARSAAALCVVSSQLARAGPCNHANANNCCTVKSAGGDNADYMGAASPAAAWGAVFKVEECYGPAGPRSWYRSLHNPQTQWGGANYKVWAHPCCLQPGANCGLILDIHGMTSTAQQEADASQIYQYAGAESEYPHLRQAIAAGACPPSGQPVSPKRFIVVNAE
jgi:hypothetical protein